MDEVRERVLSQINNDELIELASGLARFQSSRTCRTCQSA